MTKTTDGKASFLHVLADAVQFKCPELVSFGEELPSINLATRGENTQDRNYLVFRVPVKFCILIFSAVAESGKTC